MICIDCGREFERHAGKGGQSKRCPECLADHRAMLADRRNARRVFATMAEWIEVLAPHVRRLRREVDSEQSGKCKACGEPRRLLLAIDDEAAVIYGLCQDCYGQWLIERRST